MIKNLTKHGNSLAQVIDKGVLELLEIDANTPLHISTDGKCLVITPVRDEEREKRFKAALAEGNEKYAKMLKNLAE